VFQGRDNVVGRVWSPTSRASSELGERSDQFPAEVRDVGDDAAPDRVESGRETSEYVSEGVPRPTDHWSPPLTGVGASVRIARLARRRVDLAASAGTLLGSRYLIGWVGLPFPEQDGSNPQVRYRGQQPQVRLQIEEPYRLRRHHHGDRRGQYYKRAASSPPPRRTVSIQASPVANSRSPTSTSENILKTVAGPRKAR
jgi:hypothetical protein